MSEVVAAPVREGDVLVGKYRVDRILGAGGMGVVVAATHLQLEQRVALKFLVSSGLDEQAGARFLREARAVVRLRSEHVVRVLDTGTLENGLPYIVMELLEGRDLAQELSARGPVSVVEAVDWVLQACEGIAEAHAVGIVHRDLKPANLFLTHHADHSVLIKVLDFGIAKVLDLQRAPDYALTKTATLMGSPHYMSPEQIRNAKSVDQRADIWALGIVLYELLCGRAPFSATTAPALLAQIVADPPEPLRPQRPEVPRGLDAVISRCLEKEPSQRFPGIRELSRELARFGSDDARASSERISRICSGPAAVFPRPSGHGAARRLAHDPTLIAIEPPPRRGPRSRWALPLTVGVSGCVVVLGLALAWRDRGPAVTPATSVADAQRTLSAGDGAAQPARAPSAGTQPEVTPARSLTTATGVAQGVAAPAAASSAEAPLLRRQTLTLRLQNRSDARRPSLPFPARLPGPAPSASRAHDPAPAPNPLDDRK